MLEVSDVAVRYRVGGGLLRPPTVVHAVNGVSLSVASGESLGVVGESGCGKSSFARALAGLVPVSAGTIRVADRELTGRRDLAAARLVQMVFRIRRRRGLRCARGLRCRWVRRRRCRR